MSEVKNYSPDLQKLFVQFMLTDPQLFTRVMGIVDEKHFDIIKQYYFLVFFSNCTFIFFWKFS